MSIKPPKIAIPGLKRGEGVPAGYMLGRLPNTGRGPAQLLTLAQLRSAGIPLASDTARHVSTTLSNATSQVTSLSAAILAGSGGAWAAVGTGQTATGVYDFAVDGAKANIDFAGLGSINELLIIGLGLTCGTTGVRIARVSVDSGVSFFSTGYSTIDSNGVASAATGFAHSTNSTAARDILVHLLNLKGAVKWADMHNGTGIRTIFNGSASDINAVRVANSGGGNITGGTVYLYGR